MIELIAMLTHNDKAADNAGTVCQNPVDAPTHTGVSRTPASPPTTWPS
jgi:hypothetical protein